MNMSADTYDTTSKLKIDYDVLARAVFKKTLDEKIAFRIGNEATDPVHVSGNLTVSDGGVSGISVEAFDAPSINTEYEITLPDNIKKVIIRPRIKGRWRLAFASGETVDGGNYMSMGRDTNFNEGGLNLISKKIYVRLLETGSNKIEITKFV